MNKRTLLFITLVFLCLIWQSTYFVDIDASGYIQGKKSGVYGVLNSPASIATTTADSFFAVPGTFTNNPIENFSLATDKIVYNGTKTQYFVVNWNCSVKSSLAGVTVHCTVKNDSTYSSQKMGTFLKNLNEYYAIGGVVVLPLSQADSVQLVVESDNASTTLTFTHFTTTIREFFD